MGNLTTLETCNCISPAIRDKLDTLTLLRREEHRIMLIAVSLLKPVSEVVISIPLPDTLLGVIALSFVVSAVVGATVSALVVRLLDAQNG